MAGIVRLSCCYLFFSTKQSALFSFVFEETRLNVLTNVCKSFNFAGLELEQRVIVVLKFRISYSILITIVEKNFP